MHDPMEWIVKEQYAKARLLEMNSFKTILIESANPIRCYVLISELKFSSREVLFSRGVQ